MTSHGKAWEMTKFGQFSKANSAKTRPKVRQKRTPNSSQCWRPLGNSSVEKSSASSPRVRPSSPTWPMRCSMLIKRDQSAPSGQSWPPFFHHPQSQFVGSYIRANGVWLLLLTRRQIRRYVENFDSIEVPTVALVTTGIKQLTSFEMRTLSLWLTMTRFPVKSFKKKVRMV